ncbi:hypothetical protein FQY83_07480 [Luteimonas marina]|uniref:DUF1311 domain-containing protein n=1 Tax=Luteimonas marina TaxID=488485 RepID=A0A5C5U5E9_9GAMM|nr:hypothetical protein [Luteimonas marina]TWT21194.1 hypothetical protein FQY83_07480 [Luteimonas marina]
MVEADHTDRHHTHQEIDAMNLPLRALVQCSALSLLALACASALAQRAAVPVSPAGAATGYADYLPGCKQRLGVGYPDAERRCKAQWEKAQAAMPLAEAIHQALGLAAKGVPDAALPQSLTRVAWLGPAGAGAPREGRIGDLAVQLPGRDDEGRPQPRLLVFQKWAEPDGEVPLVVALPEALHARGDALEQIGCWGGGGSGVKVFRLTGGGSGGRAFALQINSNFGRAGNDTTIRVALDGHIPTREQLQAKYEYYNACD